MKEIPYVFTRQQLMLLVRASVGIANEYYAMHKSDEEVYELAVEGVLKGLDAEREVVKRRMLDVAETQIYPFLIKPMQHASIDELLS